MNDWLKSGEQTIITSNIKKIGNKISKKSSNEFEYIINVLKWIHKNIEKRELSQKDKEDIFRKRTSTEIIKDGYSSGCTDICLVFISLSRFYGIPTKYLECVSKNVFRNNDCVNGHVLASVYIKGSWYIVDPDMQTIDLNTKGSLYSKKYNIFQEDYDSWSFGVKSMMDLREFLVSKLDCIEIVDGKLEKK